MCNFLVCLLAIYERLPTHVQCVVIPSFPVYSTWYQSNRSFFPFPPHPLRWEPFFTSLCGKFGLLSHITEEAGSPDPAWNIADACVRSWLLGSVGPDVLGLATAPDQTARALWLAIRRLFEANKARAPSSWVTSSTP